MKFETLVDDLVQEFHASSSSATGGASGRSSAATSNPSTERLVAAGAELMLQVVSQVTETIERSRQGSGTPAAADESTPERARQRDTSDIEDLVRRVVTQARELAARDRRELVRQLTRPDKVLSPRGRTVLSADAVRGRVNL